MIIDEDIIRKIISELEAKRDEANRFIIKYKTRKMQDLEEYYKGAKWALEYAQKVINETMNKNNS